MKHTWLLNEDGTVNEWMMDDQNHNGRYCTRCKQVMCMICKPNMLEEDCSGEEENEA